MKKFLVIVAAGGALALGVPAALAATDDATTTNTPFQNVPVQTQESTPAPQQERPNGDDCPDKPNDDASASTAGTEL